MKIKISMMKWTVITLILFSLSFTLLKAQTDHSQLSLKDFKESLKPEMNYQAIVDVFGKPDKDIGSGIYIYVYTLKDSTEIHIGYTHKILYARHIGLDDQLIDNLLPK